MVSWKTQDRAATLHFAVCCIIAAELSLNPCLDGLGVQDVAKSAAGTA